MFNIGIIKLSIISTSKFLSVNVLWGQGKHFLFKRCCFKSVVSLICLFFIFVAVLLSRRFYFLSILNFYVPKLISEPNIGGFVSCLPFVADVTFCVKLLRYALSSLSTWVCRLRNLDACCYEDVDWDNLLEHRLVCFLYFFKCESDYSLLKSLTDILLTHWL